ncbi:MAG: cupin domain-containing protein [Clostridiales bacterium]|nr:cupin domain-containing protein [Clostridiales bacterium]
MTKKEEIKPLHIGFHPAYEYDKFEVSPRNGGNQCAVIFYDIAPGKSSYPFHYHSASEEIFYIISGHGIVETNDGEFPVSSGSIIICPAGENGAHKITNKSDSEVLTYIDIDTVPKTDMCIYPKSGKIGVFTNDGFAKLYKLNDDIKYYDGE